MQEKLSEFHSRIRGEKVTVLGIGVSNTPLIEYLVRYGALVSACDKREESALGDVAVRLREMGVTLHLGPDYLKHIDGNLIFKTPGMRFDIPELNAARERGAEVTSEMEVLFELCPAEILAVTGSDGKTTTTTLIREMLQREGYHTYLGGNIGTPLLSKVDEMKPEDKVILELSSFQLHTMKKSPHVAVITNLAPNHLDWHTGMDEYLDAKKNIFRNQSSADRLILNYDNELTRACGAECPSEAVYFSRQNQIDGIFLKDGVIFYGEEEVLPVSEIFLPGAHNVENYMAAIGAVWGMVKKETVREVARTFHGVPHRIEPVREIAGVRYYNDSIASSPSRTTAGLNTFDQSVILIAGGYDKKIPFDQFGFVVKDHVKKLILMGNTADKIEKAVKNACGGVPSMPVFRADSMEEAVAIAGREATEGDVVLLSPACASFDKYKDFEERGNHFKRVVEGLS